MAVMKYTAAWPYAGRLYLTHINKTYPGDIFFPRTGPGDFPLISRKDIGELSFRVYERMRS